jgi:hypothetical protein
LWIDHSVRRLIGNPGDGIAMLLAHRLRRHDAVAEGGGEFGNCLPDRSRISGVPLRSDLRPGHKNVLC